MKTQISLLLLFLILVFSCKKTDPDPAVTCRLDKIDRGNGYTHEYTYDTAGKITNMRRVYGENGVYAYTFTYNSSGVLIKSDVTLNGKPYNTETYTYTNGKVSQVSYKATDGDEGVNNIKYDTSGNLTEFSYEAKDKSYYVIQYFEYDSQGLFTKRGYKDMLAQAGGFIYFEARYTNKNAEKSPESLLLKGGLPYDILTGFPWGQNVPGVGSTSESFSLNESNRLVSEGVSTTTNIIKNSNGYATEIESKFSGDNSLSKSIFSISNCK
jgi:hypothetical protein